MANIQNVVATLVVPNQPKSLPNQQIFVYTNKSDILNIISGDTIVGAAHKDDQGYNIADRFSNIINGTIKVGAAQNADHADTADNATNATTASKAINDGNNENIADHFDTVEHNISVVYSKATDAYTTANAANNRSIENAGEIAEIKSIIGTGENYIGTLTLDHTPTAEELNTFVLSEAGRAPKGNDVVIVVEQITGETDKNYKYIYKAATSSWGYYEIPPLEKAGNGTAGIVIGTYNVGKNYDTLVSIVAGEIREIYIKIDGSYVDIRDAVLANKADILKIVSGVTTVAKATSATNDGNGNNIVSTYMTKTEGATKAFVRDYALPKQFNNVLYVSANGFSDEIPTTPASGIQFTATAGLGETLVGTCEYTLSNIKMQLSRKNSYSARLFMRISAVSYVPNARYRYKVLTYAQKVGESPVLLCAELLPYRYVSITNDQIASVDVGMNFEDLGETVVDLGVDDKIIQEYYVVSSTSDSMTVDIFSNSVYPSRMNLNTSTMTFVYRETEVGETIYLEPTLDEIRIVDGIGLLISVYSTELHRLGTNWIPSNVTIHLPDISGITGISDTLPITFDVSGPSMAAYNFVLNSADNSPAQLKDLYPFKTTSGEYYLFGTVTSTYQIQIFAPRTSIRGTITIYPSDWATLGGVMARKAIPGLEDNDDIFCSFQNDYYESVAEEAGIMLQMVHVGGELFLGAEVIPTAYITLVYTVRKN